MFRTPAKPGKQLREESNRTMTLAEAEELGLVSPDCEPTGNLAPTGPGRAGPGRAGPSRAGPQHTSSPRSSPGPRSPPRAPAGRRLSLDARQGPPRGPAPDAARAAAGDRISEAHSLLVIAKEQLKMSRNTSREIIKKVVAAVERMFELVKESQGAAGQPPATNIHTHSQTHDINAVTNTITGQTDKMTTKILDIQNRQTEIIKQKIDEQTKIILENKEQIEKLTDFIQTKWNNSTNRPTYAGVAAGSPGARGRPTAMHSIIVGTKGKETGDEVFQKIRKVIDAKGEGMQIDKIRRARENKIIVGCKSKEGISRIREKLAEKGEQFTVLDMQNKDPLIRIHGVLKVNTNEDIVKALRTQNAHLFAGADVEQAQLEVRYRARARNPLATNVVVKVPPAVWQGMTAAGAVHVDMQRLRVTDQTPLIQCSRCLAYGHGKRYCLDAVDVCGHCGGPHLRSGCPIWLADGPPTCVNCTKAKLETTEHGAFSNDCPVRRKWDALARSTVAYC